MSGVLVTGGTGFMGTTLVRRLIDEGCHPRVLDLNEPDAATDFGDDVEFIKGDVRDGLLVGNACTGVDTVYHLAAAVLPTRGKGKYMSTNCDGTRNVLQASMENGVKQVVHVSTSAIFGVPEQLPVTEASPFKPMGYYGNAKFLGEQQVGKYRQMGLRVCVIRPRTIIGRERLGIFHILFDWMKHGKRIPIIGDGTNLFQFVSSRDVVEACVLGARFKSNDDFNIGAEEFSTVRGDLEGLIEHIGSNSTILPIPSSLAKTTLQMLDLMRLSPLMDWQYKVADKPFYFDVTKAKNILGWRPKDSNLQMFTDTYDWYVDNFEGLSASYGSTHRQAVRQRALSILRRVL